MLAVSYEKTQEIARDLRTVGCGDLDVEGNELNLIVPDFYWLVSKRNNGFVHTYNLVLEGIIYLPIRRILREYSSICRKGFVFAMIHDFVFILFLNSGLLPAL